MDREASGSDINVMDTDTGPAGDNTIIEPTVARQTANQPLSQNTGSPANMQDQYTDSPSSQGPSNDEDDGAPDPVSRLNELEEFLRQPDAVMEPNILDRLGEYVRADGNPRHAVEFLTENYVGYAQMATLVCSWLQAVDKANPNTPAAAVEQQKSVDIDEEESLNLLKKASEPRDELYYLRELVRERFNPAKFSGIFLAGGSGIPKWLNPLIADAEGRSLIYDLSSTYKNCLLLNFAIQKILMQPGREAEVAAVGSSLVGYFGVFHRLITARLREIAAATSERELQKLSIGFCKVCAQSQHAYVHAQLLLHAIGSLHDNAIRFKRLSEDLEAAAALAQGSVVYKMRRWLLPPSEELVSLASKAFDENIDHHKDIDINENTANRQNDGDISDLIAAASGVLADMLASATTAGGPAPTPDVLKLHKIYFPKTILESGGSGTKTAEGENSTSQIQVPPAVLLRHPGLFSALIYGLFNPGRPLQADSAAAHIDLLSLAAAATDDNNDHNSERVNGDTSKEENGQDRAESMDIDSKQQAALSSKWLAQPAVVETIAALKSTANVVSKSTRAIALTDAEIATVKEAMQHPVCAAGVMRTVQLQLAGTESWATAFRSSQAPSPLIGCLTAIIVKQPNLHHDVLELLKSALDGGAASSTAHTVSEALLVVAAELTSHGYVLPTLQWAERWAETADPSLVRHLMCSILQRAGPPYSVEFARRMLRLLSHSGFRRARLGGRDWSAKVPLLVELANECGRLGGSSGLGLTAAESAVLKELQSAEQLRV